jgi:hypothetical protein
MMINMIHVERWLRYCNKHVDWRGGLYHDGPRSLEALLVSGLVLKSTFFRKNDLYKISNLIDLWNVPRSSEYKKKVHVSLRVRDQTNEISGELS